MFNKKEKYGVFYKIDDELFAHAYAQTVDGFWTICEPIDKIDINSSDIEFANFVFYILDDTQSFLILSSFNDQP